MIQTKKNTSRTCSVLCLSFISLLAASGCKTPQLGSSSPEPDWIKQGSGTFVRQGRAVLQGVDSFKDTTAPPNIQTQAANDYAQAQISRMVNAYIDALIQAPEGMVTVSGNMSEANISPRRSVSFIPMIASSATASAGISTGTIENSTETLSVNASSDTDTLAAPEQVRISGWNTPGAACDTCAPQSPLAQRLIADGKGQVVAKITLNTESGDSRWLGLKLDRWMASISRNQTGKYDPPAALINKAADVANIKVWMDNNHDGLLETDKDILISPANGKIYKFPETTLVRPLGAKDASPTDIYVASARKLYPSDNPFTGDAFERLVLNDNQTNETKKEIVICTGGVEISSNVFHHCYRAQEGTSQIAFASGTALSGPARIPIVGTTGIGGQLISTAPINVFVTYDLDFNATISTQALLGLIIPNANYFLMTVQKPAEGELPDAAASELKAAARAQLRTSAKIEDHWTSPDGALHALCIVDISDFNKSLEEYPGLGELASQYVHLNADKALRALLQPTTPQ